MKKPKLIAGTTVPPIHLRKGSLPTPSNRILPRGKSLLAAFALWGGLTGTGSADLIVQYTFDGDVGSIATDAADAAGGDNFGTIGSGSSFTTDLLRGDVLSTGGADGLLVDSLSSATGSYTFSGWFKGTDRGYFYDQTTNRFVISVEENTTNSGEGTVPGLGFWDGAWKNSAETEANDGEWHHLVWVLDGGSGTFSTYVDGVAIDVDVLTPDIQTSRAASWTTIGDGAARFFAHNAAAGAVLTGLADDIRIYDNALSSSEVGTLFADTLHIGITALSPGDEASVDPAVNLVATFTKDIALKAGGTITLTDLDDGTGTTVMTLPDARVTVSGADLIIDPSSDLEIANYEVVIDASAIEDTAVTPEAFAGTSSGQWAFSTATLQTGPQVKQVAGDGVITDETLTTSGGTATLDAQIGSNWAAEGGNGGGAPNAFSSLTSPTVTVPTTGPVTLSFFHRYNFEPDYDGGAIFISVNGGPATYVEPTAFSQNGYVGIVNNLVWTGGEEVFHGQSAGFGWPTLIRSVANLGTLNAGDTVAVDFRGGWDPATFPAGPNWEIGAVTIQDSASSAILDVDFSTDATAGFTAVTTAVNPAFPGGWEYPIVRHTFEINADTLEADRYAADPAGSIIDLNGADIVVELATGTLNAGDEFILFDLSGGTTLTGSIGNLILPPGIWDSSTLAIDGRIILLLPETAGGPTAGADFFMDASQDTDTMDGRAPDLAEGNPTGYDVVLDDDPAVAQVSVSSANFPKITSAYELPGGAIGNDGGIHLSTAGAANNQRSFHEAPGDWSNEDVTFEIWFKPDSLTPINAANTNGQILFEDGGATGIGFFLDDSGEIQFRKAGGNGLVAYDLIGDPSTLLLDAATAEFIQVVGTYDVSAGAMEMFINGTSVGTATPGGNDWSGGDGAGIGTMGDVNIGGIGNLQQNTESLDGQVAIFRAYRNQLLTESEVAANFTDISTADTTPPVYISLSPANLTTGFFVEFDLVASFSEDIALTGAGSITLRNLSTASDSVISLPDAQVSVSGNQLTINPTNPLAFGTNYAVLISSDAIEDLATTPNAFAGISDQTRWTFTTDLQDLDIPMVTSLSPADDATEIERLAQLVVTFDETVFLASGDITLKNLTNATESTISITDATQVLLADNILTITPTEGLLSETDYAVQIAAGVVTDLSGNAFDGILDDTTWSFTSGSFPAVLFADTFNRPDSADLNESTDGKFGLYGALNWGSGSLASVIDINGNAMRINNNTSPGNDGSWAWVEHNFSDLEEFTVTLDITAQNSGGDGRLAGFRVGQTLSDISGEADAATGGNAADVAVYLDNIGGTRGIKVFEGSTDLGYVVNFASGIGVLSATFTCTDTNAGTTLNYEVFLNGVSQYIGSTTWSGTDENYISVQSNSIDDTRFDSFTVTGRAALGDYGNWAENYPGADLTDPNGDSDGDGLSNDYERQFGLNPTDSASVNPIVVPFSRDTGTFSFTRRDDALTGLFTDIETSFDLEMWTVDGGAMLDDSGGPDANGIETVEVTLSPGLVDAPRLFLRVNQNDGLILSENFENGDGGFTAIGSPNDWEYGLPNSDNEAGLVITKGNGGSANCWGTNLATASTAEVVGGITPSAESVLRSPNFSLIGAADAQLQFAAAVDALSGDTIEVQMREVGTDILLVPLNPITAPVTSNWTSYGPLDLSAGAGKDVYLEFRYQGSNGTYLGLYIDDVTVSKKKTP